MPRPLGPRHARAATGSSEVVSGLSIVIQGCPEAPTCVQHVMLARATRDALYLALAGLVRDGVIDQEHAIQIGRGCCGRTRDGCTDGNRSCCDDEKGHCRVRGSDRGNAGSSAVQFIRSGVLTETWPTVREAAFLAVHTSQHGTI